MRGRKCAVSAQGQLAGGGKPAQLPAVLVGPGECRRGELHLVGKGLHPDGVSWPGQQADGGRIATQRSIGERVYVNNKGWHSCMVESSATSTSAASSLAAC